MNNYIDDTREVPREFLKSLFKNGKITVEDPLFTYIGEIFYSYYPVEDLGFSDWDVDEENLFVSMDCMVIDKDDEDYYRNASPSVWYRLNLDTYDEEHGFDE